jgi:hypothetical protein
VKSFNFFALIFSMLLNAGCAYHFGMSERALPGGYSQVAIPMFKNLSADVGIEPYFTNALIRRFSRSAVAKVTDKDSSPLVLNGTILDVQTINGPAVKNTGTQLPTLPDEAVLITEYRLVVNTHLELKRRSDDKIMWQGNFRNEKVYTPPRIGTPVVNTANATYNQSVRMETISRLAEEMMNEAHDRMTENF